MIFRCALQTNRLAQITNDVLRAALHELLRCHQLGYHHLILTREVADFFRRHIDLNQTQLAILSRVREEYTQYGSIHLKASIYCELSDIKNATKFGPSILLPFSDITPDLTGQPSQLVVEDSNSDGYVLNFALLQIKDQLSIPRVRTKTVHGGGSSITRVFEQSCESKAFTVCVSDSDKDYPNSALSYQVRELVKVDNKFINSTLLVLPCREIENMIPLDVVEKLQCAVGCEWISIARKLEERDRNLEFWMYLDIKLGMSSALLAKKDGPAKLWFEERLLYCGINAANFTKTGFGLTVVPQLTRHSSAISAFRQAVRSKSWFNVFGGIMSDLGWWFASSEGVRA